MEKQGKKKGVGKEGRKGACIYNYFYNYNYMCTRRITYPCET